MVYTELTKRAMIIAEEKHRGQVDKNGYPYIFHPFTVASKMEDEVSCAVALLHDVVEDTGTSFEELKERGITDEVIKHLRLVTHDKKVPYLDYVRNMLGDEVAMRVKVADLSHNSDLSRLKKVTPADLERVKKYEQAKKIILDYINNN